MTNLPLIIGHRGASAVAPENTLAAFTRAIQDGAEGIEFDVRLSQDGVPVVIHDATLARTGLIDGVVAELSAEVLGRTDVGSWFSRRSNAHDVAFSNEKLPSLQQVFDLFADSDALLYLEMKSQAGNGERLAAEVTGAIRKHAIAERMIVSSFNLALVRAVKVIDPAIRTAALFEPRVSRPASLVRRMQLVVLAKACAADEICLHHRLASRSLTEQARNSQLEVVVWTVDNPEWIERARARGVKALITNDPGSMVRYRNTRAAI
ncbi:MAG: glycerophosphodiester phosphodiesterase [Pyrinomonadaceae bacterium]